jgi:Xaa-Pro aminopeptidase
MRLPQHTSALQDRRTRLAQKLGTQPALFASGFPRPRNYAANAFEFRANSHFLYLFGVPHPDAWGLYDGQTWRLYLPEPGPDDALWEGEVPSFATLSGAAGVPVRPLGELEAALKGRSVAALPTPDLETCDRLGRLLGREVRPGKLGEVDVGLAEAMIALRLRHDEAAVAELRLAAEATDAAHRAGMRATRPGMGEAQVRAVMEAEFLARDLCAAYSPIVTVHGEVLHNHQYHHRLEAKDMLLADVGAESPGGFAGDVTRTWPVSGTFSTPQRELYEVVLRSQKDAIAAVKPGTRYRDVHLTAHRTLAQGLVELGVLRGDADELVADGVTALLFPHGVGHLLGLDVHDMEDLGDRAGYAPGRTRTKEFGHRFLRLDRDLAPGMAVTIEPGLYLVPAILQNAELRGRAGDRVVDSRLKDFMDVRGIRIEDDVIVTESGCEVLTARIPKEIRDVEAVMAEGRR